MKAKARQRANWKTSSVKSPHKVNASFGKKKGIVISDGIIFGNRRKMIVARSEEKKSAYGYIYAQEEEDTARAMSVLEKYAQKR